MKRPTNKPKTPPGTTALILCSLLVLTLGVAASTFWLTLSAPDDYFLTYWLLLWFYAAVFFSLLAHEAGHWLFGVKTGYRFLSFRVGSHIWCKRPNGKIEHRRFWLPGTGGQCLLAPPLDAAKHSSVLYLAGGILVNAALTLLCGGLAFLPGLHLYLRAPLLAMANVNLYLLLLNGIPALPSGLPNDAHNLRALKKHGAEQQAQWTLLRIAEYQNANHRLRDMPEALFALPPADAPYTAVHFNLASYKVARLLDEHRYMDAWDLLQALLARTDLPPIAHRGFQLDLLYLSLIGNLPEEAAKLYDKPMRKLIQANRKTLSGCTVQYTVALLLEQDLKKAEAAHAAFCALWERYPYPATAAGQYELLQKAYEVYAAKQQTT